MRKRTVNLGVVTAIAVAMAVPTLAKAKAKPAKDKKPAEPALPAGPDPAEIVDATPFRDKLVVVTDGKGHYLAAPPDLADDSLRGTLYYSADGKSFYQQRVPGYGSSGPGTFSFTFWEPRVVDGWKRSFDRKAGDVFELQCDDRNTRLTKVAPADTKTLLAGAQFLKPRWKYRAYALARDDSGRYFYVDKPREPENSKAFRLYMGKKNELKPLKMVNVVSDSKGDIFATKSGELRLVIPKEGQAGPDERVPVWIKGKQKTPLTWVPIEDNGYLIYVELGVYTGQPLGTPCDDL
jgi:hypothetical protein